MSRISVLSPPDINPELRADIEAGALEVYEQVATDDRYDINEVHYCGVCVQVSRLLLDHLVDGGHQATVEHARVTLRRPSSFIFGYPGSVEHHHSYHDYVVIDDAGNELIADATWQQYLKAPLRTTNLPKVLMGQRPTVYDQARDAGIRDIPTLSFWLPRSERY